MSENPSSVSESKKPAVYISKLSEEENRDKNGNIFQLRLKVRVDSMRPGSKPDNPVVYITCLSGTAVPISQEEAVTKAKGLWQDGGNWNVCVLVYKEVHPADIKLDDLESMMIPEDPEAAQNWCKMENDPKDDKEKSRILQYVGNEFVKVVNLFLSSGYVVEYKEKSSLTCALGEFKDLHELLIEKMTDSNVFNRLNKEPDFFNRFKKLVFIPSIRFFRESFTADGIIKKIIVTDVDLDLIPKLLDSNTDKIEITTDRLLSHIVSVEDVPLRVMFTNKTGDLAQKAVLGKDQLGTIYVSRLETF